MQILGKPQFGMPGPIVELLRLAWMVPRTKPAFLEIGSWCGESSVLLGTVASDCGGILLCIDTWDGNGDADTERLAAREDVFAIFTQNMEANTLLAHCRPLRGRSEHICKDLASESFDFIFIDGDHHYKPVLADVRHAKRLIRPGGIICGHDYECLLRRAATHTDVVRAVLEAFPAATVRHTIWSVLRNGEAFAPTGASLPGDARCKTPKT